MTPRSGMHTAISSAASISASVRGGLVEREMCARMLMRSWVVVLLGVMVPKRVSRVVLAITLISCFVLGWNLQMSCSLEALAAGLGRRKPDGDMRKAFWRWLRYVLSGGGLLVGLIAPRRGVGSKLLHVRAWSTRALISLSLSGLMRPFCSCDAVGEGWSGRCFFAGVVSMKLL